MRVTELSYENLNTCKFTKKPECPNDFRPTAIVSHAEAIIGLLAAFRPSKAIPGPIKPIDCMKKSQIVRV
jgi:hypothetical protein